MPHEASPTARYHRLAEEALGVANTLPVGEKRDALVQMAQVWQRLADEHAKSTGPLSPSRGEEQPVMQQQQQVQPHDEKE